MIVNINLEFMLEFFLNKFLTVALVVGYSSRSGGSVVWMGVGPPVGKAPNTSCWGDVRGGSETNSLINRIPTLLISSQTTL